LIWQHVLESIQRVHTLTSAARSFLIPAFSAGLWFFAIEKLLAQFTHMIAILYVMKFGSDQFKLVAVVVDNFVVG
jgi:hypothetical protein